MNHPGKNLIEELRSRGLTQKAFSLMLGKRVSEVNELIKGKRNITIQWDLLLSNILGTPEKFRIHKQIDYDYSMVKIEQENNKKTEQENDQTIVSSGPEEHLNNYSKNSKKNYDFLDQPVSNIVSQKNKDYVLKEKKDKENIFIDF